MAVKQAKAWNEVAVRRVIQEEKGGSLFDVMVQEIFETPGPRVYIRYWKAGQVQELETTAKALASCEVMY